MSYYFKWGEGRCLLLKWSFCHAKGVFEGTGTVNREGAKEGAEGAYTIIERDISYIINVLYNNGGGEEHNVIATEG